MNKKLKRLSLNYFTITFKILTIVPSNYRFLIDYIFIRNIILNDIEKYVAAMNDGAVLMISGFYGSDLAMLDEKLQSYGLALEHSEERNDWTMAKFVLHRA